VPLRELDNAGKEVSGRGRSGGVVGVVEEKEVGALPDLGGDSVEVGGEGVLFAEREIVEVGAREERARRVRRVAGLGGQADVAALEASEGDVSDPFLPSEDRDHFGVGIDPGVEPVSVEGGNGLSEDL
jgi:hypothetical protein